MTTITRERSSSPLSPVPCRRSCTPERPRWCPPASASAYPRTAIAPRVASSSTSTATSRSTSVPVAVTSIGTPRRRWTPKARGAEPLEKDEPLLAIVHCIVHRGTSARSSTPTCMRPAAPRTIWVLKAAWTSPASCRSSTPRSASESHAQRAELCLLAGRAPLRFAMKHASQTDMHHVGGFLHVRPLASIGTLSLGHASLVTDAETLRAGPPSDSRQGGCACRR